MPIGSLLRHRVSILRRVSVVDALGQEVLDDRGSPVLADDLVTGVAVAIQPKTAREVAALHEAGAAISTHTIFAVDRSITTADAIIHDPATCPMANDLPGGRYELSGTPDAAGVGHHLELDARLISSPELPTVVQGGGGGSGSGMGSGS